MEVGRTSQYGLGVGGSHISVNDSVHSMETLVAIGVIWHVHGI